MTNLQRRTDRLKAIDETGRQISSILELDELLPYVAKSILETFGYEMVRVFHLTDCCSGRLVTCARQTCGPPLEVSLAEPIDLDERGLWDVVGERRLRRRSTPARRMPAPACRRRCPICASSPPWRGPKKP